LFLEGKPSLNCLGKANGPTNGKGAGIELFGYGLYVTLQFTGVDPDGVGLIISTQTKGNVVLWPGTFHAERNIKGCEG